MLHPAGQSDTQTSRASTTIKSLAPGEFSCLRTNNLILHNEMGCCESTPRVDPGQQDNGFQSMGPRPVEAPTDQAYVNFSRNIISLKKRQLTHGDRTTSQIPTHDSDRDPDPPPSDAHVITSLPVVTEPLPGDSPSSELSPGTTPAVKTETEEGHDTLPELPEGSPAEGGLGSPSKSTPEDKRDSSSSSSSSSNKR